MTRFITMMTATQLKTSESSHPMKTKLLLLLPLVVAAVLPSCTVPVAHGPITRTPSYDTPDYYGSISVEGPYSPPPFICGTIPRHDTRDTPPFCGTTTTSDDTGHGPGVCPGPVLHPMPTLPGSIPTARTRFPSAARVAPITDHDSIRRAVRPIAANPVLTSADRMAPVTDRDSVRRAVHATAPRRFEGLGRNARRLPGASMQASLTGDP